MLIDEKKRVGILGGTFNPIHIGHLILAECAYDMCSLDKVLIMPSGNSYLKDSAEILPTKHRVQMAALAIEGNKHFELSMIEVERSGNTYTYETLEYLSNTHPDTEFFFILGADSLMNLEKWNEVESIFKNCTILAASRYHLSDEVLQDQINYFKTQYNARIELIKVPTIDISSQMIRNKVDLLQSIRYFVPKDVENYIYQNTLFKKPLSKDSIQAGTC